MTELLNSQRRFYKATYAPINLDTSTITAVNSQGQLTRALEKTRFIASLGIYPVEIPQMKGLVSANPNGANQAQLSTLMDLAEKIAADDSPQAILRIAPDFAKIDGQVIIAFGNLLAQSRQALADQVAKLLDSVRADYIKANLPLPPPVVAPANGGTAPANGAPAPANGTPGPVGGTPVPGNGGTVPVSGGATAGSGAPVANTGPGVQPAVPAGTKTQDIVHSLANNIAVRSTRYDSTPANATDATGVATLQSVFRVERIQPPTPASNSMLIKPPSLAEAIRWATINSPQQIDTLQSLTHSLSPVPAVYSQLDTAQLAEELIAKVKDWPQWTMGLVDGFNSRMTVEPVGRLHLERLDMTPVGVERGELIHSVPLAPKETINIAHKEWSTTSQEFESIVQDSFEGYSEQGVAEKSELSQSTDSESKHSNALNLGATVTGSYGLVTVSATAGYQSTSDDSEVQKDSRNHSISLTRKASVRTKKDHKVTFKVASRSGTEDQAVQVITNPSDTNAMRIDYFQLLRKWRVDLFRYGLRMTYDIAIPNPGGDLRRKIDQVRALDAQINQPFDFPLAVDAVRRDNWADLAAKWQGVVDPPPDDVLPMSTHKDFKPQGDNHNWTFDFVEFDVPDDYEVIASTLTADYTYGGDPNWPIPTFLVMFEPYNTINSADISQGPNTYEYTTGLDDLIGKSGKLSVLFKYIDSNGGALHAELQLGLKDPVFQKWQFNAWSALQQAAEQNYYQARQSLKDARDQLTQEIANFDALTLRRMEQEEIMKGVLRWLFGPGFELVPWDIQQLFEPMPDDPMSYDVKDVSNLSNQEWQRMLEFGEFIKYIHEAIEWENVLFFTYPYFWNSPENWNALRFLDHPDLLHRAFLRAGSARVVLTIRPGYEESFTSLVETGAFGQLPQNHPYMTIAQEIENYAKTNYPGIPPANPDDPQNDANVLKAEQGKLIGRWYEYTPTNALDISLNTVLPQIA
jgi:hypothetical protein